MYAIDLCVQESEGGGSLARKLVDLYFTMFKLVVEGNMGLAADTRKTQVWPLLVLLLVISIPLFLLCVWIMVLDHVIARAVALKAEGLACA